ncbi:hypothetical protein HRG_008591 [Hirsutella rhossiliensis]|uniref:FAR1 domain-containing protein n=1 Tax=Hirsutella rhossiliensis TaxID=111463 RepID=A0A9P8SF71_9HYPO|nr:uncharacterized protein HRG_08591 [Hirsutella rhossiliensis]KAH0960436.1 hypothetical protein HRG_08591 [Hirsutella rhossiliensis]
MESMSTVFSTTYESEAEATRACKTVGWEIGFGLRRRNAKPSARAPTYVLLVCTKYGPYVDNHDPGVHESKSRPNTSSQCTDCKFALGLKKQPGAGGGWTVQPTAKCEPHNHPFTPAITHSGFRAEVISQRRKHIIHLYNCGLRPYLIAAHLRGLVHEDPSLGGIQGAHIANALAAHRREELANRTPIQFLYDLLKDSSFGFFRDARDGRIG